MVVSSFSEDNRKKFFKKSFLLADFKPDVVLKIVFLIISNIHIDFQALNL